MVAKNRVKQLLELGPVLRQQVGMTRIDGFGTLKPFFCQPGIIVGRGLDHHNKNRLLFGNFRGCDLHSFFV